MMRDRDVRHTSPLQHAIYAAVRLVPRGKVATYGQIAAVIGKPRAPRAVGRALRDLPDSLAAKVPWQRVINAAGKCSERGGFWADRQRERLQAEGVHVNRNGKVDMREVAWEGPRAAQAAHIRRQLAAAEKCARAPAGRSIWVASPKPGNYSLETDVGSPRGAGCQPVEGGRDNAGLRKRRR